MDTKSTIRAYQKVLTSHSFLQADTFSEQFAQERFAKKFQEPDPTVEAALKDAVWAEWLSNDQDLPQLRNKCLPGTWYRARLLLQQCLEHFRLGEFRFPQGSEFAPTQGKNSLEARLCTSDWTCTYENFGYFSELCYTHSGLKRAARKRYLRWFRERFPKDCIRGADRRLWSHFKNSKRPGFAMFEWKLTQIVSFHHGSRFSSVPKNNSNRRPINVECMANVLTQSQIGIGISKSIKSFFGIDLNVLQDVHRVRIADQAIATIDLSNASDSISLELVEFLLPKWLFRRICGTRASFVLGPDGSYYETKKVSSMGNGFTFELMTLILTCICRTLDPEATVFGDDIIIDSSKAQELMSLLQAVGLKVNISKSFWDGPFRESCGGNYHHSEGYIRSFDFEWPENISDCIMIANKASYLGQSYKSFKVLAQRLLRATPKALQGVHRDFFDKNPLDLVGRSREEPESDHLAVFPPFVVTRKCVVNGMLHDYETSALTYLGYNPIEFEVTFGYRFVARERTVMKRDMKPNRHWAKYLMYLDAGRRCPDSISGEGEWIKYRMVTSDKGTFRSRYLKEYHESAVSLG